MKNKQKKSPGGKAGAKRHLSSSQSVVQPIPDSVGVPAGHPGEEFWLKTDEDGSENAYEIEPTLPHLTVKVVTDSCGRQFEQTWTRTRKFRFVNCVDFLTPRPPKSGGWVAHELPKVESLKTSGVWRRPISGGWELIDDGKSPCSNGKVWQRPGPHPVEERVLSTYHVIERPEGQRPISRKVSLIDTRTKDGLVEETLERPDINLFELGLGWEATGDRRQPDSVVWRRSYVKKGGAQ